MVFSTVSDLSGKAANLTGDTANFVIELPGRLISAGGRLFERPQPAPTDAPPQKRQALWQHPICRHVEARKRLFVTCDP